MTLQKMIELAAEHFMSEYPQGFASECLFECYAKEQLGMDDAQSQDFVAKAVDPGTERDEAAAEKFYTWYYINRVCSLPSAKKFDTLLYAPNSEEVVGTSVEPVKDSANGIDTCAPEEADFWVVFADMHNGERICVAECADKESAEQTEHVLLVVGMSFKQ